MNLYQADSAASGGYSGMDPSADGAITDYSGGGESALGDEFSSDLGGSQGGLSYGAMLKGFGGLTSAYGSEMAGTNQYNLLNRQAGLQRTYALQALQAGNYNSYRQSILANKSIGATAAGFGAAGVDQSSGSVAAVIGASHANAELDRQNLVYGSEIRAWNAQNQAAMDEASASSAKNAGDIGAIANTVESAGVLALAFA